MRPQEHSQSVDTRTAVISGHSHVPKQETRGGVLYFNPGSAGPRRFKLPVTVGKLMLDRGGLRVDLIQILE